MGCPYEAEVNLLLTMNEQIHEMNMEFRGIDRATDVLSFPMVDLNNRESLIFLRRQMSISILRQENFFSGDIVISKEKL